MKAVIDRFEGDYAVVLFGADEILVNIPIKLLPEGVKEGTLLNVAFDIDYEGEANQRKRIASMLEKLKNKNK